MSQGGSGTFYYSPDIKAYIKTVNNGTIDISEDIMTFNISRISNGTSTASFVLSNKSWKYTPGRKTNDNFETPPVINTMDQITVFLKRVNYVQVFTGYVTYAPIVTLVPSPIELRAHCSLYIIQNTFWDIGIPQYQALMPGYQMKQTADNWVDGGTSEGIINVLTQVVKWGENLNGRGIHISNIPRQWFIAATNNLAGSPDRGTVAVMNLYKMLDGAGIIKGQNLLPTGKNGNVIPTAPAKIRPWVSIPHGFMTYAGLAKGEYAQGESNGQSGLVLTTQTSREAAKNYSTNSQDVVKPNQIDENFQYWCIVEWPYLNCPNATLKNQAIQWLSGRPADPAPGSFMGESPSNPVLFPTTGRKIILTNVDNGRQIIVGATFTAKGLNGRILLSSEAWQELAGPAARKNATIVVDQGVVYGGRASTTTGNITATGDFYTGTDVPITAAFVNPSQNLPYGPVDNNLRDTLQNAGYSLNKSSVSMSAKNQTAAGVATSDIALKAANIAQSNNVLGKPYIWGGQSTKGFDCSGLVYYCYNAAGKNLGDKTAQGYYDDSKFIVITVDKTSTGDIKNYKTLKPGDLLFWGTNPRNISHVSIYVGGGQMVQAIGGEFDQGVRYQNENGKWRKADPNARVIKCAATLQQVRGPNDNRTFIGARRPTGSPNVADPNAGKSGGSTNNSSAVASPFNTFNTPNSLDPQTGLLYGTPQAIVTNVPVLNSIQQLCTTSLRNFCSAPNGDFVAWFPDYFGVYSRSPVLDIRDIEIIDFKMYHDDTALTTNVAISGDPLQMGTGVSTADWLESTGTISVTGDKILELIYNTTQDVFDALNTDVGSFTAAFSNRYGIRPYVEEVPQIRDHNVEMMYAYQTFMRRWAAQFQGLLTTTFMPEAYPGMRIRLGDQHLEMYVESVTHQGSREGGFSTEIEVVAPVYVTNNGRKKPLSWGYPKKFNYGQVSSRPTINNRTTSTGGTGNARLRSPVSE